MFESKVTGPGFFLIFHLSFSKIHLKIIIFRKASRFGCCIHVDARHRFTIANLKDLSVAFISFRFRNVNL